MSVCKGGYICKNYIKNKYSKHDEKKLIKEYEKYLLIRKEFDKQNGIIQPIRACVRNYSEKFNLKDLLDTTSEMQNLNEYFSTSREADSTIEEYRARTTTVGYFCSYKTKDNEIVLGCSFCRPKDFPYFSKWRGKLLAMAERCVVKDVNELVTESKAVVPNTTHLVLNPFGIQLFDMANLESISDELYTYDFGPGRCIVYYFPKNLILQAKDFIDRCCRYYGHVTFHEIEVAQSTIIKK